MHNILVEHVTLDIKLLDYFRRALAPNDVYQPVINDHEAKVRAGESITAFVAKLGRGAHLGYATVCHSDVDIITLAFEHERAITTTLLEHLVELRKEPFVWWTRSPRTSVALAVAKTYGAQADRTIFRMEQVVGREHKTSVKVHTAGASEIEEVVRINNEAFAGHPDRANLTVADFHRDLRELAHHNDLLLADGGFVWLKKLSPHETEIFVLGVDSAHRGQGLGKALLETALEHARVDYNAHVVSLFVEHSNTRAIQLYEHFGFVVTDGSLHGFRFPGHA